LVLSGKAIDESSMQEQAAHSVPIQLE
jgi:hypothetical protein